MRDLLDRNRQLDLADAAHEFTRGDLDLHARERGADAAMHADTESDVAREIAARQIKVSRAFELALVVVAGRVPHQQVRILGQFGADRKSGVEGKSVSVRLDRGGG